MLFVEHVGPKTSRRSRVKWWKLAAEQYADAQFLVGAMYALGKGVLKDYVRAHMWGTIAATNGNKLGTVLRDFVAEGMTPADISAAQKLARECVRKKYKGC